MNCTVHSHAELPDHSQGQEQSVIDGDLKAPECAASGKAIKKEDELELVERAKKVLAAWTAHKTEDGQVKEQNDTKLRRERERGGGEVRDRSFCRVGGREGGLVEGVLL